MGSVGQAVGGVVGGVVGGYFGGAQGAFFGFSLGMAAGSFVDPPRGARQNIDYKRTDLYYDTSARNMPVPIVYGVNRVGGNMLWIRVGGTNVDYDSGYKGPDGVGGSGAGSGGSKGSAKAGGEGQTPTVDIAWALALSEGPIVAVSEVFLGDKRLSYMDDISYTAYTGTPSQTADPRLTSDLGSLAPAFRHTAYMTLDATIKSPNVPVINAEISGIEGTPVNEPYGGYPLGANAFAARALVQADGSFLASTHINETLYRSTDYGEHWSRVGSTINGPAGYILTSALGDHPGVYGRAYFAMFESIYNNVRVFTSNDFGKTWVSTSQPMNPTFDASCVLGVRGNSSEVLCFTRFYPGAPAAVWRSTDSALTFEQVYTFGFGWYAGVFAAIQPPGTDVIWAHGSALGTVSSGGGSILFSGDRGQTWEVQAAPFAAIPDGGFALNANVFGFGGNYDGGGACYITYDGGALWNMFPISEHGIGAFHCNSIGILLAAGTNRCWYSTTLGRTWREMDLTTFGKPTIIPLWLTSMWFTNEQVCFGSGVPASVTCLWMTVPTSCGNPALIVRDLLTNARYGKGLDLTLRLNEDSFRQASNYCIAQVPSRLSSGHLEQRFCLDYVVDAQQPIVDHLRDMLATFGGYLCWSQGDVKLKIDQPASSTVQSFGMGTIVKDSFQWKKQSLRERPNVLRVDYVEPGHTVIDATGETLNSDLGRFVGSIDESQTAHIITASNYKTYKHDFVESSDPWDIERTGERRERTLNLSGIKRRSQAQRIAEYYLAKSIYCQHICGFRVGINALRAEVGDVIAVSHDVPGWAGKLFRLMEIQEFQNDELQLGCIEYNENVYRATAGAVPGQDPITGRYPPDWTAAPYSVGRLTAYERPNEDSIEITYTRIMTSDLFGGAGIYKRIGEDGAWQLVGTQLSTAPTAYLASHVETITLVES